ncbi:hypothetical protein RvY_07386 [Ramazzottius varieornatus]|uniref:Uncharacterized protein n=1 Tax=Ramazzottius varieornatus TaxID=947166 RepID=A0A1D1V265_RAMVA|nr:hypothetical protein RvY_07386 [Ramazzottius varieornatus]
MARLSIMWTFVLLSCSATALFAEVIDDDSHEISAYFPDHKPYVNSSSFRNTSLNYYTKTDPSSQAAKKISDVTAVVPSNGTPANNSSRFAEKTKQPPSFCAKNPLSCTAAICGSVVGVLFLCALFEYARRWRNSRPQPAALEFQQFELESLLKVVKMEEDSPIPSFQIVNDDAAHEDVSDQWEQPHTFQL